MSKLDFTIGSLSFLKIKFWNIAAWLSLTLVITESVKQEQLRKDNGCITGELMYLSLMN
jgi:hypothetical protein